VEICVSFQSESPIISADKCEDFLKIRESPEFNAFSLATAELQKVSLQELSTPEEKLTFWINIYNLLYLHGV
jgi:hypothetical protein